MRQQRFHKDDLVRIDKVLPASMGHFSGAGKLAYVLYSYEDEFGPHYDSGEPDYALEVNGMFNAWYPEGVLKLVKRRRRCPCCKQFVRRKSAR